MKPIDFVKLALRRWKDFQGRSRRAEYWWFVLAFTIVCFIAGIIDGVVFGNMETGPLQVVLILAALVPSIAVSIRRLHDIGRTGWWLLIGLIPFLGFVVLLYFHVQPGIRGENRFGPDPLEGEAIAPDPLVN